MSINVEMGFVQCFWYHDVITHFRSEPGKRKKRLGEKGKQAFLKSFFGIKGDKRAIVKECQFLRLVQNSHDRAPFNLEKNSELICESSSTL